MPFAPLTHRHVPAGTPELTDPAALAMLMLLARCMLRLQQRANMRMPHDLHPAHAARHPSHTPDAGRSVTTSSSTCSLQAGPPPVRLSAEALLLRQLHASICFTGRRHVGIRSSSLRRSRAAPGRGWRHPSPAGSNTSRSYEQSPSTCHGDPGRRRHSRRGTAPSGAPRQARRWHWA